MKYLVVSVFIAQGLCFSILPTKKCQITDSACLKTVAQEMALKLIAGAPEYKIDTLDPMHFDDIKIHLYGLKLDVMNVSIEGLKDTVIDKLKFDTEKKQMSLSSSGLNLKFSSQYKAHGKVIVLPVLGDGDASIIIKNIKVEMISPYKITKNGDGKHFIILTSFKYKYEVVDNMTFNFTNLFNGNKQMSDMLLKYLNDNWKQLSIDFGSSVFDLSTEKVYLACKNYLQAHALEDVSLYTS